MQATADVVVQDPRAMQADDYCWRTSAQRPERVPLVGFTSSTT